jgi:hypothetical protein
VHTIHYALELHALTEYVDRWAGWAGENARANTGNQSNGIFIASKVQAARLRLPGGRASAVVSRPRPWFDDMPPGEMCNAVTECGAVGNNHTDDTAALQACIQRCPGQTYCVTTLPSYVEYTQALGIIYFALLPTRFLPLIPLSTHPRSVSAQWDLPSLRHAAAA